MILGILGNITQSEPIAWWLIGVAITALLSIIGTLLLLAYKGLIKRLDALENVMQKILDFISRQEQRNEQYDRAKERLNTIEDKVLELDKAHKVCVYYPLNRKEKN